MPPLGHFSPGERAQGSCDRPAPQGSALNFLPDVIAGCGSSWFEEGSTEPSAGLAGTQTPPGRELKYWHFADRTSHSPLRELDCFGVLNSGTSEQWTFTVDMNGRTEWM